jgi:geranylgeranyl diphosphate synthase type I
MGEVTAAEAILERYRPLVDAEILRMLAQHDDLPLYEMVRHHLGCANGDAIEFGGKRVRAAVSMLACEGAGGAATACAPAAAAVELLHSFTLLHDDVADRDDLRRGRPTVWHRWGVGQAITAGDAVFALANLTVSQLQERGVSAATVCAMLRELNQAALAVCEGQQLDISYEGRSDVQVEEYFDMITRKTGALFAHAAAMGAMVGGAPADQTEALRSFGRHLGVGYQIRDDTLGIWGDPSELGKPVGSDLRQNKRSLPIIHALAAAAQAGETDVAAALAEGVATDEDAAAMAERMAQLGSRELCEAMARESLERALVELDRAGLQPDSDRDLRVLAKQLMVRTR